MELRVEAALGFTLPKNCFIGVRVGDVLKQGRYEPQRCYNFPQLDRRRNAKVDIYQHVGTCMVAVDPDTKATHEVAVSSLDPETPASRIKIHVAAMSEENKQQREQRTKALKVQARDYLMKYSIEERLSEAVKALLKEQPADPTAFLCKQLTDWDKASAVTKEAAPAASDLPQVFEDESVNRLRKDAREAFVRATDDGSLESALNSVKGRSTAGGKEGGNKEPTDVGKEDLRLRVSNLLVDSAENGDLERALASVMQEGLGKMSKEEYMEKIKQDAAAGQKQKPEFYAEGDESEIIRLEAQNLLVDAMKNGTLEGILDTVLKDGKVKVGGQGDLQKTISGHLCSVPPEQTRSATQRVVKDLSAADQSKIRSAIQKIEADPKDALRIKVAELMLAAPDKNLDSTVATVMKDLSKADKQKIAEAIEKLEVVREAKAERAELRATVKDLLQSSSEAELPRHAAQVMQGLSPEDRKKIQDAIQLAEASNAKTATGGATSSASGSSGQTSNLSKGEELMMATPENHKHQLCSIEVALQGMAVDDRKKIRDSVQHLEASSPADALRIKAAELTMASNPNDQLAAITEAMKGLKAPEKKKIADAIEHLEANSENDAVRIKAAEMMLLAPSNAKHQHFAIAAAMKGISADERKKIQDELQNVQASGDGLQQKVVDLMATPPVKRHQRFAIAAALKDLGPAERTKVFQSVAKAEATSMSSKKQDALAAMAADLLLTAAEEGKFENKLAEAIEDRKEEEALPLRERLTLLLERANGKDLRKELPAIMQDLSDAEQKKIIVAVRKVQGDPHHALRVKTAELMLSAPEGTPLEQSVAATIKELSAAEKSKLREAVEKVENSAPKLAHTVSELLKSTPEDQLADAIKGVIKDLSASDRSQVQQAMQTVEADPHHKLRLTMAELMNRSAGATQGAAVAASLQELPAADRQKISEAVSHVEAFHSPVIFQNEMMNTSMNSFGMQPGLAIM